MLPMLAYWTASAAVLLVFMLMVAGCDLPYSQLVNCGTMMIASATMMIRTARTFICLPFMNVGSRHPPEPVR